MYDLLLVLHSLVRWAVLAFALWALLAPSARSLGAYAHTLTLQVVLGVVLAFVSPLFLGALNALGPVLAQGGEARFFVAEHWVTGLLALGLAHAALGRFRRGREARLFLVLSLGLLLLTVPWFRPLLRL